MGQTTVPKHIVDSLHIEADAKLYWTLMPDGTVTVRAKTKSLLDLAGVLKAPKGKIVSIKDMNAWRSI